MLFMFSLIRTRNIYVLKTQGNWSSQKLIQVFGLGYHNIMQPFSIYHLKLELKLKKEFMHW